MHDNFSLGRIFGPKVTNRTLSPGPEKLKFLKCSVSNQISWEGYLWILWVWYGLIFLINTPQSDLFMVQVDFMLFLRLWVWSIKAPPNPVRPFPNYLILFLNSPNMYRKYNHGILNPGKHIFHLILNLPIKSSPWFSKKKQSVLMKTFLTLFPGDGFAFDGTRLLYYDLFYVSEAIWHPTLCWKSRERLSRSQQRNKECGFLQILNVG